MGRGAKIFVSSIFVLIGFAFLFFTSIFFYEFRDADWFELAKADSHLFLFFPTLGIVALLLMVLPSAAIVDLYWTKIRGGRWLLTLGLSLLLVASLALAQLINSTSYAAIWEVSPNFLVSDKADPPGCQYGSQDCRRLSILSSRDVLAKAIREGSPLSKHVHFCDGDVYEARESSTPFCFATGRRMSLAECCNSMRRMQVYLSELAYNPHATSFTHRVYKLLLPVYVFFALIIWVVGVMLGLHRSSIQTHYPGSVRKIEQCLVVIALILLVWGVAYLTSIQLSNVVPGIAMTTRDYASRTLVLYSVFTVWYVGLLLFFTRKLVKAVQEKMVALLVGAVGFLTYDKVVDAYALSGAGLIALMFLASLAVSIVILLTPTKSGNNEP